nr:hypothetical protein GCM10020093_032900 [Planobispora longispora]
MITGPDLGGDRPQRLIEDLLHAGGGEGEAQLPAGGGADRDEILQQFLQPQGAARHGAQHPQALAGRQVIVAEGEDLQVAQDAHQRGAQLVADGVEEGVFARSSSCRRATVACS